MARVGKTTLKLRRAVNTKCQQCKNKEERKDFADDALCPILSVMDGLAVRCVGDWAEHKIFRLSQYFGIFAKGMRKRWKGLNYVEICSGPGRCVIRRTSEEIDGTALAILNHPRRDLLAKALFIDLDERVVFALNERIRQKGLSERAEALIGDYRDPEKITELLARLPTNCLNLVFIDPTKCDVPFKTVERIAAVTENVDLIINVSVGTDIGRNLGRAVLDPAFQETKNRYEEFLGDQNFFLRPDVKKVAALGDIEKLRRIFSDAYSSRLDTLGFIHRDVRPVLHYYYLLFASRHPKGLDFWQKACAISPQGQREFNFERN